MTNLLWFILGFVAGFLLVSLVAVCDFLIKRRKAKKVIKDTVDGCGDINELVDKLNQLKNIFTYEGDTKND